MKGARERAGIARVRRPRSGHRARSSWQIVTTIGSARPEMCAILQGGRQTDAAGEAW